MALDMLREIQAFVSVAHKRSFVAAARALGRSPSAVTRAVQTLEDNAASKLLNRNANAVTLTEAGERLLPMPNVCWMCNVMLPTRWPRSAAAPKAGYALPYRNCWVNMYCHRCLPSSPAATPG